MTNTIFVETRCPFCATVALVEVPEDGFIAWQNGKCIQDALPNLEDYRREQLISGICPACWDDLFEEDESEEEYDDFEFDDSDFELGFDPYLGCYSDDC